MNDKSIRSKLNSSDKLVQDFYTSQVRREWQRLMKDAYHRLEFRTTLHFLDKYLPPQGHILDAGGGPGRYTYELAKKRYDVTLLDATQANIDFASRMVRRHGLKTQVKQIITGSIVDLSQFPDASFDAVLCSGGPLSHVLEPQQRNTAISELIRVVKPSAPLFVSVMGRLSVMVVILMIAQHEIELPHFKQVLETGDYLGGHGFTACHFFLPEELRQAFTRPDVEFLELVGLEGVSSHHARQLNQLAKDDERLNLWMEAHLQTCTHPSVVGMSEHMLIVCRKNLA
jgi:2-polyprenyl-3-methyl-5-hydroxy-6-metoxy-1,4-benzoquinol methylase